MPRVRSKKEGDEDIDFDEFLGVNRSSSKKIKKRGRSKKAIGDDLKRIYADNNGDLPDMSKIYHKKKNRAKGALIGFAVFFATLAVLSWAGFLFFGKGQNFSGEKVVLEITSPDKVAGGDEVEYIIKYGNNEEVPLGQGEMEIHYPDNFVFTEAIPVPAEEKSWQLGSLAPGAGGEIKIRGILRGKIDSLQTLQAIFSYKPGNFNSDFQKVATAVTKMEKSSLEMDVIGPTRVLAGGEATFKIKYKNISSADLTDVRILVTAPSDFSFKVKEGEKEKNSWDFSKIEAGKEAEMEFSGIFGPAAEGKKELKAQVGFINGEDFAPQSEDTYSLDVAQGAMLLTLVMNGDANDRSVNFGDALNYSINFKNKEQAELGDVEVEMVFESTSRDNKMVLDWSASQDSSKGTIVGTQISPTVRQGKITWTKKQIPKLAKLAPGEESAINFQIRVRPSVDFGNWGVSDFAIKSLAAVKVGKIGGEVKEEKIDGNIINLKINSDVALGAEARYFNDDNIAVGSGSLPPKVGETTTYRIFWKVSNSLHEIENIKVVATLPANVKWSNKTDIGSGEIKYNEATRKIEWTLNKMPTSVRSVGVNFEVTATPVEADKGKQIVLTENTILQAQDKSTNGAITKMVLPLTSNLDGDPMAEGKGIVK